MIRFRINGSDFLDLPEDFQFSFSYNNSLFAFDSMQLSRSTEFQIPRTPQNDILLSFSHDPNKDGGSVRTRKDAELFYSGGKIDGFLSIGKFSGGGYSAIFVYGELTALKTLKEKGNIAGYADFTDSLMTISVGLADAYDINGVLQSNFSWYYYKNGISALDRFNDSLKYSPTVKLAHLMNRSALKAGIIINTADVDAAIHSVGLILPTKKRSEAGTPINFLGIPNSTLAATGGAGYLQQGLMEFKYKPFNGFFWKKQDVVVFGCLQDLTIKCTAITYDKDGMCVGGNGRTFYSGYPFGMQVGDQVSFKKGDYFTFVSSFDYFNDQPTSNFGSEIDMTFDVSADSADEVGIGDTYYLQDNLPDITLVDIFKIYANLLKRGIDYDALTNTVSFFDFNFDKSAAKKLDDIVIDVKSVDRTFLDYAQKNIINYKSEDYVTNKESLIYNIKNDNITAEKVLFTIPFSEGNKDAASDVLVSDYELFDPFKLTAKTATIAVASKIEAEQALKHVSKLYDNFIFSNNLRTIIENSTTLVISVKMSASDFLKIKNKDTFSYFGQFYCCLSGTQNENIAELTLVKL